jgi:ribosomal protein S18 acetylase RimI-like enzyme
MSIAIRAGQPSDLDAIRDCVMAAYMPYIARIGRRPAPMDADYAALLRAGEVYVVPDQAGVTAVLVVRPLETALLIENVVVHPAYQGQGIGRALLGFAERLAIRRGLASTTLYTNVLMTENITLYQRLGYVETERRSERGFQRVYMRKALRPAGG